MGFRNLEDRFDRLHLHNLISARRTWRFNLASMASGWFRRFKSTTATNRTAIPITLPHPGLTRLRPHHSQWTFPKLQIQLTNLRNSRHPLVRKYLSRSQKHSHIGDITSYPVLCAQINSTKPTGRTSYIPTAGRYRHNKGRFITANQSNSLTPPASPSHMRMGFCQPRDPLHWTNKAIGNHLSHIIKG